MKFKMILAADSKGGIGKGGALPWEGLYCPFLTSLHSRTSGLRSPFWTGLKCSWTKT